MELRALLELSEEERILLKRIIGEWLDDGFTMDPVKIDQAQLMLARLERDRDE